MTPYFIIITTTIYRLFNIEWASFRCRLGCLWVGVNVAIELLVPGPTCCQWCVQYTDHNHHDVEVPTIGLIKIASKLVESMHYGRVDMSDGDSLALV